MLGVANERRAHLERIFVGACRADKNAVIPHCVDHIQSHRTPACRRCAFRTHVDAKEKAGITDRTNAISRFAILSRPARRRWPMASAFSGI